MFNFPPVNILFITIIRTKKIFLYCTIFFIFLNSFKCFTRNSLSYLFSFFSRTLVIYFLFTYILQPNADLQKLYNNTEETIHAVHIESTSIVINSMVIMKLYFFRSAHGYYLIAVARYLKNLC